MLNEIGLVNITNDGTIKVRKAPKNARDRNSKEYKEWRLAVFKRDNYKCCCCNKTGKKLNAHHIKRWSEYPSLRYDIDNGITLCESCHKAIHKMGDKYGKKKNV